MAACSARRPFSSLQRFALGHSAESTSAGGASWSLFPRTMPRGGFPWDLCQACLRFCDGTIASLRFLLGSARVLLPLSRGQTPDAGPTSLHGGWGPLRAATRPGESEGSCCSGGLVAGGDLVDAASSQVKQGRKLLRTTDKTRSARPLWNPVQSRPD